MSKEFYNKKDQDLEKQKPSFDTQGKLRQISINELKQIFKEHKKWLKSKGKEGERADLNLSNLKKVTFKKVILAFADMQRSNLIGANLQQANLIRTNLKKSYCSQAN